MPLPNERACRLHPPSRYERFRRNTRRSAGKVYSVIFGIKANGTSEEQAYRYNKSMWTVAQARAHCKRHDGTFEPARESNMKRITISANLERNIRTEMFDGRAHVIAPVVLLVEGVHTGMSGVPLYYSPDALRETAYLWDGTPITINHPQDEHGEPVSANQPNVLEAIRVGQLFNVWFDENGNKLKGELWIDAEKARQLSPDSLTAIQSEQPLEVSTGLYFEIESTSGEWNDEHYDATVSDFRPDHLALLPGQVGACSWADGCGVRVNQKKEGDMPMKKDVALKSPPPKSDPVMVGVNWGGVIETAKAITMQLAKLVGFSVQEASHDDIRQQIQAQLDAMDTQGWLHFVRDIYDTYVVYEARYQGNNPSEIVSTGAQKFYRRDYSIGSDEKITLADESQEVKETREWVPITNQAKTEATTHKKEESKMDIKELVEGLITNEKSKFDEKDREWLGGLTEQNLAKISLAMLQPCANEDPLAKEPEKKPEDPPTPTPPEPAPEPEKKPEGNEQPVTVDQYVANAPAEVASVLTHALAEQRVKKDALVAELVANKRCNFTKEQLDAKDVGELEQLAALANVEVDFTGRSGAPASNEVEALTMPPVFEPAK